MHVDFKSHAAFLLLLALTGCQAESLGGPEEKPEARQPGPQVTVGTRDELIQAVRNAKPGTTVRIAPGTYAGDFSCAGIQGTKEQPIILTALDPKKRPLFQGGSVGIFLNGCRYLELQNLEVAAATVNGVNADDAGNPEDPPRGIVLRNLYVHDVGPRGNSDGFKLSGLEEFQVVDCVFERWGSEGSGIDMVGCHNGEVVGCTFRHKGDNLANGVQTKGGSSQISVRHCRFENAGGRAVNIGGSTDPQWFRPVGANYEAKDITVEDCTFIGSLAPVCFVGVDGATVQHNTIYCPDRWLLRVLQENQAEEMIPSRNGKFKNNVVAFRRNQIREVVNNSEDTSPETFQFSGNYWYCIDNPPQSNRLNLPTQETNGRYGVDPQFVNEQQLDLRLRESTPVRDAGPRPRKTGEGERSRAGSAGEN